MKKVVYLVYLMRLASAVAQLVKAARMMVNGALLGWDVSRCPRALVPIGSGPWPPLE